jgi:quinol monooxygenase YgiN
VPLAFAVPGQAQTDQTQFVVVYVELLPAAKQRGGELLEKLARLGQASPGAISFTANQEIQRPNFYVLIEEWKDVASYEAFQNRDKTKILINQIQPLVEAPFDERDGVLIK